MQVELVEACKSENILKSWRFSAQAERVRLCDAKLQNLLINSELRVDSFIRLSVVLVGSVGESDLSFDY